MAFATVAYGVGNWHLYNGDAARAEEIITEILRADSWAAFGYLAAEADLARGPTRRSRRGGSPGPERGES